MERSPVYSQEVNGHRADIDLLTNYLNVKNVNGIFLEMGACDGVSYSNTKALEDDLGYRGILIEPGEKYYEGLVKNRPNCKNYKCIVSEIEGDVDYIGDSTGVGGAVSALTDKWIDAWGKTFPGAFDREKITKVRSRKLSDILHETKVPYIDFWSLDVEGSELGVLKTMDWNIPVYIICMEVTAWGEEGQKDVEECREIMRSQGFTCDGRRRGLDEFWINENYFRKNMLFRKG